MTNLDLGFLITTSDASWCHFDRVLAELTRLGYPFAVNFDRCSVATKKLFAEHPLCIGCCENDDPNDHFDETHKQRPLDILVRKGFKWAAYIDTDEVFDRRAPELIPQILQSDADLVWCPLLDFWQNDKQYRVDGKLGPCMDPSATHPSNKQFRDKFYNLQTGTWKYLHADVHRPYFTPRDLAGSVKGSKIYQADKTCRRLRSNLYVLHYGLINEQMIRFKHDQWRTVYKRKLGRFVYQPFYDTLLKSEPVVEPFDYNTFDGQ